MSSSPLSFFWCVLKPNRKSYQRALIASNQLIYTQQRYVHCYIRRCQRHLIVTFFSLRPKYFFPSNSSTLGFSQPFTMATSLFGTIRPGYVLFIAFCIFICGVVVLSFATHIFERHCVTRDMCVLSICRRWSRVSKCAKCLCGVPSLSSASSG
jgi:hypothetical protein